MHNLKITAFIQYLFWDCKYFVMLMITINNHYFHYDNDGTCFKGLNSPFSISGLISIESNLYYDVLCEYLC